MKSVLLTFLYGLACLAMAKDHPVEKVIGLLKDLKAKAISEGQEEEVSFGKFQYWCQTSTKTLKDAIAEEKETIDELNDSIAGKTKEIATLKDQIGKLEDQIAKLQSSAKDAEDDRTEGTNLYEKVNKDLEDTISAVEECIKALEAAEKTTEGGGEAPLQLSSLKKRVRKLIALVSVKATQDQLKTLVNFAAPDDTPTSDEPKERPEQLAEGDLEKHTDKYDFKSENVVELLKQLKLKFEDDKLAATKEETNAQNAYDLSKAARDNSIKAAEKSKSEKEDQEAAVTAALTTAQDDLKNEEGDLEADSKSLEDTQKSCSTKTSEWEERSKTRALEIEAMDKAMEILSKATGVRTEAPGNPVPPPNPVAAETTFLQLLKSDPKADLSKKMKAVELLRKTAKELHSKALERLGMEVSNHLNGHFDEVNNMIEKMIFRLMDEQKNEDEHKAWCDKEIEKTQTMEDNKNEKIDDLNAELKVEKAAVQKLTTEIQEADDMVASIVKFQKEATEVRETGKSENKVAIKDAKDAQEAIANAVAVLEAFYKESGEIAKEPWEFIQKGKKAPVELGESPSTWDSSYTGVADPKAQPGGIIAVLEEVSSDFSQMESKTRAQETVDQEEYEEAMKSNDIEKARRSKESEMKEAEKGRRVDKISHLEASKKDVSAELEKTVQYMKDLQPACVDGDSTYADRKKARASEIQALHDAQGILADAFKEKADGGFLQSRNVKRHF